MLLCGRSDVQSLSRLHAFCICSCQPGNKPAWKQDWSAPQMLRGCNSCISLVFPQQPPGCADVCRGPGPGSPPALPVWAAWTRRSRAAWGQPHRHKWHSHHRTEHPQEVHPCLAGRQRHCQAGCRDPGQPFLPPQGKCVLRLCGVRQGTSCWAAALLVRCSCLAVSH